MVPFKWRHPPKDGCLRGRALLREVFDPGGLTLCGSGGSGRFRIWPRSCVVTGTIPARIGWRVPSFVSACSCLGFDPPVGANALYSWDNKEKFRTGFDACNNWLAVLGELS